MAEVVDRLVSVRAPERLHLGAVFGGAFLAVAIGAALEVLWLGIGLAAVHAGASASSFGLGSGLWSLIAIIAALFVGGLITGRLAGPLTRSGGALHGLVMWSIATIATLVFLISVGGAVVGGAARLGGTAASLAAQGVGMAVNAGGAGLQALGLDSDQLLKAVNARLAAEGRPAITAAQLKRTTDDIITASVREGRFDRALVESKLAADTALSRADVRELSAQLEQRWTERSGSIAQTASNVMSQVQGAASRALDLTAKSMFLLFAWMVLSAGGAVLGATAGVTRGQRILARESLVVPTPPTVVPPTTTTPLPSA